MNKVEVYSNWCYLDALEGIPLKEGEQLRVKWPDGEITEEKVVLESSSYRMMDHGSPCDIGTSKAFVEATVKGVKCLIRLYGQDILCERVNPLPPSPKKGIIKRRSTK